MPIKLAGSILFEVKFDGNAARAASPTGDAMRESSLKDCCRELIDWNGRGWCGRNTTDGGGGETKRRKRGGKKDKRWGGGRREESGR